MVSTAHWFSAEDGEVTIKVTITKQAVSIHFNVYLD